MGSWQTATWEGDPDLPRPRRDRRSGTYEYYVPDPLMGTALSVTRATDELVATAERAVRSLDTNSRDLAGVSRFLLRTEAIASSQIEGIAPSAQQVALAELGASEDVRGVSDQAQLVANNMTIVRAATTQLVGLERVSVDDIVELHRCLLPADARHHGIRRVQNWIGGSDWHPLDAQFVPPPPDLVPALMEDLSRYAAGGGGCTRRLCRPRCCMPSSRPSTPSLMAMAGWDGR